MKCLRVPVFLFAWSVAATAAEEGPSDIVCKFESGHTWTYANGDFRSEAPAALTFEIGGIDLEGQSATLVVDSKRSGTLRIIRALNANHFLEVANEGFLNLTTVYDLDAASGVYPAVHSRHFGLIGQPVFAQYAGTCKAKSGG